MYRIGLGVKVLPAKLKFTWWRTSHVHTPLVLFNWPLALRTGLGISQDPEITTKEKLNVRQTSLFLFGI